jgi:hypothetical protein
MRMRETGGELDFPEKPLVTQRRGELRIKNLDRNVSPVFDVFREVDSRHPTAAEFSTDAIAIRQDGGEVLQLINAHSAHTVKRRRLVAYLSRSVDLAPEQRAEE